ncbi:MAG: TIGR00730 family Rossman fold protein [Polyangiales bacterium]
MRRLCVFCGSRPGQRSTYLDDARRLGQTLAEQGIGLVYGGAHVGLMGAVADAAMAAGGEVIGVIPQTLVAREVAHRGLTQLHVVATMHERKAKMAELSDGFIALPGGLGTLEELFEVVTWAMLSIHDKPIGVLDTDGYWTSLFTFLTRAANEGFVDASHLALLHRDTTPIGLIERLRAHVPAGAAGAMTLEQT